MPLVRRLKPFFVLFFFLRSEASGHSGTEGSVRLEGPVRYQSFDTAHMDFHHSTQLCMIVHARHKADDAF